MVSETTADPSAHDCATKALCAAAGHEPGLGADGRLICLACEVDLCPECEGEGCNPCEGTGVAQ
jgi:hypothetical protein